jgi:hypothetical protein
MSSKNNVNPDYYKLAGRDRPSDMAEIRKGDKAKFVRSGNRMRGPVLGTTSCRAGDRAAPEHSEEPHASAVYKRRRRVEGGRGWKRFNQGLLAQPANRDGQESKKEDQEQNHQADSGGSRAA